MKRIYSINASENFLLKLIKEYYNLTSEEVRREVVNAHYDLVSLLDKSNLKYSELRKVLVPNHNDKKSEYAFIFDTLKLGVNYGKEVFDYILPTLNKESIHNILFGDILDLSTNPDNKDFIKLVVSELSSSLGVEILELNYLSRFFVVYINNLSDCSFDLINCALKNSPSYLGHINCYYNSFIKLVLSNSVSSKFIQYKSTVIVQHEDDIQGASDRNLLGFEFSKFGFEIISIQQYLFSIFLSYKIDSKDKSSCPFYKDDCEINFDTITSSSSNIFINPINVDEGKLDYIENGSKKDKNPSKKVLTRLDKVGITKNDFEILLMKAIKDSIIYDIDYSNMENYNICKFSVFLDFNENNINNKNVKMKLVLKYNYSDNIFSLCTMY